MAQLDPLEAVEALLKKASGKSAERALEALDEVGLAAAAIEAVETKKVRKLLTDKKNTELRAEAARALFASAGDDLPSVGAELLAYEDIEVVCAVLDAITENPRLEHLPLLMERFSGALARDVIERRLVRSFAAIVAIADLQAPIEMEPVFAALAQGPGERMVAMADVCAAQPSRVRDVPGGALGTLIRTLEDGDLGARALAAQAMGRRGGEDADKALLEALAEDADGRVRLAALRAYHATRPMEGEAGMKERVKLLARALREDNAPAVRQQAAVYLTLPGSEEAGAALVPALGDEDWRTACCAAVSLGETRASMAVDALVAKLGDADWRIRGAAAVGLGRTVDKRMIAPLIEVLNDDDPGVVGSALNALRRSSGRFGVGPDPKAWRAWAEGEGATKKLLDPSRSLDERRKYGYEVPASQVFQGLDVFVLQSTGDHIENILKRLEITHQLTSDGRVFHELMHPDAVFVANCTGTISANDAERLSWFLVCGGSVFGSCWALSQTIERIYPGVVNMFPTSDQVLDNVEAVTLGDLETNPFLRGAFSADSTPMYRLEGAHLIQVLAPERCEVLLDSPETAARHGCGNLAVWFEAGHGVVLDSVNHFDLQGLETAAGLKKAEERQAYAIDHMGLTYERLREIEGEKFWSSSAKAAQFVPDDSAFRFVTNFVRAKRSGSLYDLTRPVPVEAE